MILIKYRMIFENGCIETLNEEEAINHGNYVIVEEEVNETIDNTIINPYIN